MDIIYFLSQVDRLRIEYKMTKAEFYKAVDITASAVSQWRHKVTVPAENTIKRIADLFGVEPSFLTGEQKNPVPKTEDGIEINPEYFTLSAEDRLFVNSMISKLAKSQSDDSPSGGSPV